MKSFVEEINEPKEIAKTFSKLMNLEILDSQELFTEALFRNFDSETIDVICSSFNDIMDINTSIDYVSEFLSFIEDPSFLTDVLSKWTDPKAVFIVLDKYGNSASKDLPKVIDNLFSQKNFLEKIGDLDLQKIIENNPDLNNLKSTIEVIAAAELKYEKEPPIQTELLEDLN